MIKKIFKILIITIIYLVSMQAIARPLYIEIVGGRNVGVPIAVTDFTDNFKMSSVTDIAEVIRNDLGNSGQFRVVHTDPHNQYSTFPDVDIEHFKNSGAEHVVIGNIQPGERGTYDIVFHLMDTCTSGEGPAFGMKFYNQRPEKFRALAHHISDLIFEKVIGVRGFFSTRIAYITMDRYPHKAVHTLTIADSDGYNDKPLVISGSPLMSPKWSPDGSSIAFVSFEGDRSSIKVVNVVTGAVRRVSNAPGINGAPAWAPDGESLAVVLSKEGAPKIYILGLQDRSLRRITNGGYIDTEPCWDPSGQSIIFTSNRGGTPQIYRIMLNSGEVSRLTFDGDYNATPSVTPDGNQLVMLHKTEGSFNIATQSLKTGKVNLLTRANLDESPTIAPNGLMVLYGTKENKGEILGAVSLDGRFKMRLPVKDGNVKEPAWSPYLS